MCIWHFLQAWNTKSARFWLNIFSWHCIKSANKFPFSRETDRQKQRHRDRDTKTERFKTEGGILYLYESWNWPFLRWRYVSPDIDTTDHPRSTGLHTPEFWWQEQSLSWIKQFEQCRKSTTLFTYCSQGQTGQSRKKKCFQLFEFNVIFVYT